MTDQTPALCYLADPARDHVAAGGCSGDLCHRCNGTGMERIETGTGTTVNERCSWCGGRGLGR